MPKEQVSSSSKQASAFIRLATHNDILLRTPMLSLGRIGTHTNERFAPTFGAPYTKELSTKIDEREGIITARLECIKPEKLNLFQKYFGQTYLPKVNLIAIGYETGQPDKLETSVVFTPMKEDPKKAMEIKLFPIVSEARFYVPSKPIPLEFLDLYAENSADLLYKSIRNSIDRLSKLPKTEATKVAGLKGEIEYFWNLFLDQRKQELSPTIRLAIASGLTNF